MRAFWIMMGVLVVLATIALAVRWRSGGAGAAEGTRAALAGGSVGAGDMNFADTDRRGAATDASSAARAGGATPEATASGPPPVSPAVGQGDGDAEAIARQLKNDLAGTIESILPSDKPVTPSPTGANAGATGGVSGPTVELPTSDAHPTVNLVKAKAVRREDGALVLDEQFILRGKGTREEPYIVDFPLLLSAENTYQPRKGLKRLPQRVAFLHGAWVRVTGYVAFPITAADPKEMLMMLNQWDGCCIGVPPTPYDAVEVQLASAVTGNSRLSVHGTVTGRLEVDPFIDANFLLGLYVMKDAEFTSDRIDENLQRQHSAP